MKQIRERLTYANVMSTLAVFLVLGGAAVAANRLPKGSVGPRQIRKNAVNSAKVKNGSLKAVDFKAGQLPRRPEAQAIQGPRGDKGEKGDTGPRGPSSGRATSVAGNVELGTSEGSALVVASLALAPGKWMVLGETALTNALAANRSAWCSLDSGATQLGLTRGFDQTDERSTDVTVLGAVDLPAGGTVQLRCWASGVGIYTPSASRPAMQAVQVESLETD